MSTTARVAGHSLDHSLVSGIAWTGVVKWTTQVVSWVGTLVTVRLLAPTDYGLFGMAMVYIGFGQIVTEAGISAAVIQRPTLRDDETSELAGMSIIVGLLFTLLTLVVAHPIATFFGQPTVYALLAALSATFLIRSVQLVPRALFARHLRFRRIAAVEVAESLTLVAVTLGLALSGWRYWSLVAGSLASSAVTTAIIARWQWVRPSVPTALIRAPVRFTWQVTVSQVSWYVYTHADFAVVGRMLGSVALGSYTFAWNLANIAGERVSALVGRVTPPLFAAVQNDPPALRRYVSMVTEGIALFTLPASIGLCLVADEFVPVVAGDRWGAAIAPLRILAVYAAFRSIFYIAPQVLIATGRAQSSMKVGMLATLVLPPAFVAGAPWGIEGVALAWLLVYPVLALSTYVRGTLAATQMTWTQYGTSLWPSIRATVAMAAIVLAVRLATPDSVPLPWALALHIVAGAVAYTLLVWIALRTRLRPLVVMLRERVLPARAPHAVRAVPVASPGTGNRIILISYHFAPSSAVGALRWQKLVKLGAERGWQFDVIALAPDNVRSPDPSRWADLPPGTRVYGVPTRPLWLFNVTKRLSAITAVMRHAGLEGHPRAGSIHTDSCRWLPRTPRDVLRAWFAWLDVKADQRWARDAAQIAIALHRPGVHRAIVTCGPPHEPHRAGARVARVTGLPLVTDFRDPWSLVQRLPEAVASRAWLAMAEAHEREALDAASLIVTNTTPLREAMASRYPRLADRMIAVTNGYDDEPLPAAPRPTRFVIAYAGSIYLDRDPRPLFRGVAQAVRQLGLAPIEIGLELMGAVERYDGVPLASIAREAGIEEYVTLHPLRPRAEALEFLASASMLVVLPQDSHLAIPAKLFDYMRFEAWLLALADAGSATSRLLSRTSASVVPPNDVDAIADAVVQRYVSFIDGARAEPLAVADRFSRRTQAARLFNAIEQVAGVPRGRRSEEVVCVAS